jgi:uncharacterized protein YndB with AHSA1/START domain
MWGSLSRAGSIDTLRFERIYACPIEKLWSALITPARIAEWMIADAEVDPRPGGRFHLKFRSGPHTMLGEITRFEPPHLLEYTWPEVAANGRSLVLWELAEVEAGCRLILTHTLLAGGDIADFSSGWHWHLDALTLAVDGVATPWREEEWRALQSDYRGRFLISA